MKSKKKISGKGPGNPALTGDAKGVLVRLAKSGRTAAVTWGNRPKWAQGDDDKGLAEAMAGGDPATMLDRIASHANECAKVEADQARRELWESVARRARYAMQAMVEGRTADAVVNVLWLSANRRDLELSGIARAFASGKAQLAGGEKGRKNRPESTKSAAVRAALAVMPYDVRGNPKRIAIQCDCSLALVRKIATEQK